MPKFAIHENEVDTCIVGFWPGICALRSEFLSKISNCWSPHARFQARLAFCNAFDGRVTFGPNHRDPNPEWELPNRTNAEHLAERSIHYGQDLEVVRPCVAEPRPDSRRHACAGDSCPWTEIADLLAIEKLR